ncbi:unnamed protein product, partial [Meganyctiphanes norvegica]
MGGSVREEEQHAEEESAPTGVEKMERFLVICMALCFSQALASSPVLIWNSYEAPGEIPTISALHSTSYSSLWQNYLQKFPSDNIILFMQDALSIEDLTSFPQENSQLNKLVSTSHSVYLPSVGGTASFLKGFKSKGYDIKEVSQLQTGLNLNSDKNVVVVNLPDTLTIPQRKLGMQNSNEVIESVLANIGGLRKFTCIFTGKKSSKESSEVGSNSSKQRVTRSLKGVEDSIRPPGFHYHNCTLLYLRNDITLNLINTSATPALVTIIPIPNNNSDTTLDDGECEEGISSSIWIKYLDVENITGSTGPTDVTLKFGFIFNSMGKWTLSNVTGSFGGIIGVDIDFAMNRKDIEVIPNRLSYSCSVRRILTSPSQTTDGRSMQLVLNGFQYEAFPTVVNPERFDGAWDCVGFFTIPIWMSLITILIFLIVLFWGFWMLAAVKTNDQFDDPKKPTIFVPQTD